MVEHGYSMIAETEVQLHFLPIVVATWMGTGKVASKFQG